MNGRSQLLLQAGSLSCAALFLRTSSLAIEGFDLPKELALAATGLFALAFCVRDERLRLDAIDRLLWAGVALTVLSFAASGAFWPGIRGMILCTSCAATFTASRTLSREHGSEPLLRIAAMAVAMVATSMLLEAHGMLRLSLPGRAPGGLLGHRNFAGHLCGLSLPLFVWLAVSSKTKTRRAAIVALSLVMAALVLTRCRTAWVGAACGLAVFGGCLALIRGGPRPRSFALPAAALLLGLAAAVLPSNTLSWRTDRPFTETVGALADFSAGSGAARISLYRTTLAMIAAHPLLGVGPGGWTIEYVRYAPSDDPTVQRQHIYQSPPRATSDFLGLCAERGVLGLLLLLLPAVLLSLSAIRDLRDSNKPVDLRSVALLSLLGALVPMMAFDCPLQVAPTAQLMFLAAGSLAPAEIGKRWSPPRWTASALASLAIVCSAYLAAQVTAGALLTRKSMAARELGARLAPGNPRIQLLVAAAWIDLGRFDRCVPLAERALAASPTLELARSMLDDCRARSSTAH